MALSSALSAVAKGICDAVAAIAPGPLVVALSGGADSAVAAWACVEVRPPGSVRAVHIDHGWPGSPQLADAARAVAERLRLPLDEVVVEPGSGPSPEAAAREARLDALETVSGPARVVTGHHADDSAETVVWNLVRGAGLTGLSGIAEERHPFVRPLLRFRRSQIRRIAEDLGLPFLDDPSNADTALRRNLIRGEIIPVLNKAIEADAVDLIGRSARHLAVADAYLDEVCPALPIAHDGEAWLTAVAPLVTLPRVLAERIVRTVLRVAHPPYPGTTREVEAFLSVATGSPARADLSDGLVAEREGPHVAVYRPIPPRIPAAREMTVPGKVTFGSHLLSAAPAPDGSKARLSHDWCRLSIPEGDITVRAPTRGDRIEIDSGTKAVADALGEAGIARRRRSAWPVVESRGRIAWIPGVRVASWARVEGSASVWIEFERQDR